MTVASDYWLAFRQCAIWPLCYWLLPNLFDGLDLRVPNAVEIHKVALNLDFRNCFSQIGGGKT
jgi:hypothetical protein